MTFQECLSQAIGISQNPCPCYDDGREDEYGESLSGYYMDDFDLGLPLSYPDSVHDCDNNDLWELMVTARSRGVTQFMTEFGMAVLSTNKYRPKYPAFSGRIGGSKSYGGVTHPGPYYVVEITPTVPAATLSLKSVTFYSKTGVGGSPVFAYLVTEADMLDNDLFSNPLATYAGTYNGQGVASMALGPAFDGIIPLNSHERYFLVVDGTGVGQQNTKFESSSGCGCGGRQKKLKGWTTFVDLHGYELVNLDEFDDADKSVEYSFGIQINATLTCDMYFLCDINDFASDTFSRVIAELLVLYSNQQLIGYILSTDKANVYTAVRSQELIEKREYIKTEIDNRLAWAAENLPEGAESCYGCGSRTKRRKLLV